MGPIPAKVQGRGILGRIEINIGLTLLKGEKDQQRRGLDWILLANGKETEVGLFWTTPK